MIARCFPLLLLLLAGCAGDVAKQAIPAATSGQPSWPTAPDPARIAYLYSFTGHEDLGLRLPASRRFGDFLGGKEVTVMVRPYAIAVENGLIAVADPGAGAVHLFDLQRRLYREIAHLDDAYLNSPVGISLGSNRLFISDSSLNQVFFLDRKLKTVAIVANLERPTGIAWDESTQRLFVSETLSHKILVYNGDGALQFSIGKRGFGEGEFNFPTHISIEDNMVFVNDTMNFRIQVLDTNGKHLRTFGKHGDGPGYFSQPKGIAVDSHSNIYVADALSNRIQIFDNDGAYLMDWGGHGESAGEFYMPAGMAMLEDRLYVCDSRNGRVQVFNYLREE